MIMKRFNFNSRSFAKAKLQATSFWLVAAIIVMAFTVCTKKGETQAYTASGEIVTARETHTQTDFTIYGVWRYAVTADIWTGVTTPRSGINPITIYNNGIVASGNYAYIGELQKGSPDDEGIIRFTFNASTRLDLTSGVTQKIESLAPYDFDKSSFLFTYNPNTRRLLDINSIEEFPENEWGNYYEWVGEAGNPPTQSASQSNVREPAELTGEWHSRTITASCHGQEHYIFTADGYYKKGDLYSKHDGTWSLLIDARGKYNLTLQYKQFIDFESC